MNGLSIDLRRCYGIKALSHEFKFPGKMRHVAVYASNGVMKSSLARTFGDIGTQESMDRLFHREEYSRSIKDDKGADLDKKGILVIRPYRDAMSSSKASSEILASEEIKNEYARIKGDVEDKKSALLKSLSKRSGIPQDKIEHALLRDFELGGNDVTSFFGLIEDICSSETDGLESLLDVKYGLVFDKKIQDILKKDAFKEHHKAYVAKYNQLIQESTILKPFFDHNNALTAQKRLVATNFFKAGHRVTLVTSGDDANMEMLDDGGLKDAAAAEIKRINAETVPEWGAIDRQLSSNAQAREFLDMLTSNKALLAELEDPDQLRKNLWMAYLSAEYTMAKDLASTYSSSRDKMKDLVQRANKEIYDWDAVVKKYNKRLTPRFSLRVGNRTNTLLRGDEPAIKFMFKDDDGDEKEIEESILPDVLSEGENRAFYLLNALFEIEARIKAQSETVIVIDDIADSFDYKHKHAIVQYLYEISRHEFFHLVILTHNFDFFRTVELRGIAPYPQCFYAAKTPEGVCIEKAVWIKDPLQYIIDNMNDPKCFIAAIPFARNIASYSRDKDAYVRLTSALHYRKDTDNLRVLDISGILEDVFKKQPGWKQGVRALDDHNKITDVVRDSASEISKDPAAFDLLEKIVLAVQIRVAAERFMAGRLYGSAVPDDVPRRTCDLVKKYTDTFSEERGKPCIDILDRVCLITSEVIHINSFMYEPILDMPIDSLVALYSDVRGLDGGGGGA